MDLNTIETGFDGSFSSSSEILDDFLNLLNSCRPGLVLCIDSTINSIAANRDV